jgi:hypothetical protein
MLASKTKISLSVGTAAAITVALNAQFINSGHQKGCYMLRFFSRFIGFKSASLKYVPARHKHRARLQLESLEGRWLPSTAYVVPLGSPTDASHFNSFQGALLAIRGSHDASNVIQIEPGATFSSQGENVGGTVLGGAQAGSSVVEIQLAQGSPAVALDEVVLVGDKVNHPDQLEMRVVTSTSVIGSQEFVTLDQPLSLNHAGFCGLGTTGRLGIDVNNLVVQGDPGSAPAKVPTSLSVLVSGVTLTHLDFADTVYIEPGSHYTTIQNSTLENGFSELGNLWARALGTYGNRITGNTLDGLSVIWNLGQSGIANDQVANNSVQGGSLFVNAENGLQISRNIFYQNGGPDANPLTVQSSDNVDIRHNTVTITAADSTSIGIRILDPGSVSITNNTITTQGLGVGLDVRTYDHARCTVAQNTFNDNAVGVYLDCNAGIVDLGGGSLGSVGGNDFTGFSAAGTSQGLFAISLHHSPSSFQVFALFNSWSESDPSRVIKDGSHNSQAREAVDITPYPPDLPGSGTIVLDAPPPPSNSPYQGAGSYGGSGCGPGDGPNGQFNNYNSPNQRHVHNYE